jgi:hypothetical protein
MKRDGTARVEVAPVEVPQRDGGTRPGAGAAGGRDSADPGNRGADGGGGTGSRPGEGRRR